MEVEFQMSKSKMRVGRNQIWSTNTLTSKANASKRNIVASLSDDAVMHAIHHLVDICLQFQLYLLLFVHLVIVMGFWAVDP